MDTELDTEPASSTVLERRAGHRSIDYDS